MRVFLTAIGLFLAVVGLASGREFRFKKQVNNDRLIEELRIAGFDVDVKKGHFINCAGDSCLMVYADSEKKDPAAVVAAHVYADPIQARMRREGEMRALLGKLKAKTITPDEKDRLLGWLVERLLGE